MQEEFVLSEAKEKPKSKWLRNLIISLVAGAVAAVLLTVGFYALGMIAEKPILSRRLLILGGIGIALLVFITLQLSGLMYRMKLEDLEAEDADREAHPENWKENFNDIYKGQK